MKKLLMLAAAGEAAMGLALLAYPSIVVRLLLGAEIAGVGLATSRVAGIALIALGLACWPAGGAGDGASRALPAMLCYSVLVTLYLAYLGLAGEWVGSLLWPAVVLHAVLAFLLAHAWRTAAPPLG